jgi:two-component system, sensor histidine kinase
MAPQAGHIHVLPPELMCAVLESAPDAMLIVDRSGTIRFANRHVTELFGHAHDQLLGQRVEVLVPARFRRSHEMQREKYAQSGRPRPMGSGPDLVGLRADGGEFPVEISLSHVECEPEDLVVAAIRDMTKHLRVERELEQARAEAERANLAKSRFLATASHDLRQPVQSLSLLAGTLRRLTTGAAALEAVSSLEQAVRTMSRLLNALLDVSKLESGKVRPDIRDFPVALLLRELGVEFAGSARSKGLELIVDPAEEGAHSDPLLVGQILRNLVANAIRYTGQGAVTLCSRRDGDAVRIEVRDTGIGIPKEQLAYIYDEFYQIGGDAGVSREGYGLGLSIVQRLVRLLEVRLEVVSEVGVGSTFALTLPRAGAAAGAGTPARDHGVCSRAPPAARPQRHLLLIEDDPAVLHATCMLLGTEGYRVTATTSAAQALQRAAELRDIDIIVSDFHLGNGGNGADAIASIRSTLGRATKAVLITGDTTAAMGEQSAAGASLRLVRKPVTADELLGTLRELLGASEGA